MLTISYKNELEFWIIFENGNFDIGIIDDRYKIFSTRLKSWIRKTYTVLDSDYIQSAENVLLLENIADIISWSNR